MNDKAFMHSPACTCPMCTPLVPAGYERRYSYSIPTDEMLTFTQGGLAHWIFNTQRHVARQAVKVAERPERVPHVLAVMWHEERYKEIRQRAEERAKVIFDALRDEAR